MQLADTKLIGGPQQCQNGDCAQSEKPVGLVVRWRYGKIQPCRVAVPDAVTVACNYAEGVIPGRQIRVERLPASAGVVQVAIIAVEAITKFHLLRNQECRRTVVNLHISGMGSELKVGGRCEFSSVHYH